MADRDVEKREIHIVGPDPVVNPPTDGGRFTPASPYVTGPNVYVHPDGNVDPLAPLEAPGTAVPEFNTQEVEAEKHEPLLAALFLRLGPTYEDTPETTFWWSGEGKVFVNVGDGLQIYTGTTYNGTQLMNISPMQTTQRTPNNRATVVMVLPDTQERELLQAALVYPGPVGVKVNIAFSTDQGVSWSILDKVFFGRLSYPRLLGNEYSIDVETLSGSDRYGNQKTINFEAQKAANPSGTTSSGFIYPADDSLWQLPLLTTYGVATKWPEPNDA